MSGLLRICACAVMALALVPVVYLATRVDRAPSVVASMTPAAGAKLIGGLRFGVGASDAPSSAGDAAEPTHVHVHGADPVSAALLVVDGLVALTVIVLLVRRPRPRRAAGRSAPRRPRQPAKHPSVPLQGREDTGDDERGGGEHAGSDVR